MRSDVEPTPRGFQPYSQSQFKPPLTHFRIQTQSTLWQAAPHSVAPWEYDDDDDDNDEDDALAMFCNVLPFNWLRVKFKKTLPNTRYGATC